MVRRDVGDLQDLLRFEIPQIDTSESTVGIVVDEEPASIVLAIRFRQPGVVRISPAVLAEHLPALVIEPISGTRIGSEDGNGGDVAHGGHSGHKDLPAVTAGIEEVVLIQISGSHIGGQGRVGNLRPGPPHPTTSRSTAGWGFAATGHATHKQSDQRQSYQSITDPQFHHPSPLENAGHAFIYRNSLFPDHRGGTLSLRFFTIS